MSAGEPEERAHTGIHGKGAATLYVVSTPIGNLGDITLRAIEILRGVPLIAAEDTRVTRRLLARHAIATRLISYHARSGPARTAQLLSHLGGGADLALVTDAGTPLVSDPGEGIVAAWASAGGQVVAVPGASSVLAAVASSGVAGPRWSFEGFLPRAGRERRERIARVAADDRGSILFEAPNRLAATLAELSAACGADRPAAVCRELTKLHETTTRGSLGDLAAMVASGAIPARGEIVVVIGWASPADAAARDDDRVAAVERARAEVDRLVADGTARGDAAKRVAAETGLPRRALYAGRAGASSESDRRRA